MDHIFRPWNAGIETASAIAKTGDNEAYLPAAASSWRAVLIYK